MAATIILIITATVSVLVVAEDNRKLLNGGEICQRNEDCVSGHCYKTREPNGVCAPDGVSNGTIAAGGECASDSDCFSNYCVDGTCASDSRIAGYVAGGGRCATNDHCYSGVCYNERCGPDGAEVGRSAAGGRCEFDQQCFSRFCRFNRCGPDSRVVNVVPSGAHCSTITTWCWSKVCYKGRCTAAGIPGKVADGGRCTQNFHCLDGSVCRNEICVQSAALMKRVVQATEGKRLKSPGETCDASRTECSTAFCIGGYCVPPSPTNRTLIADGGSCDSNGQCQSGQCEERVCATSYSDHRSLYVVAAGATCGTNAQCYSRVCIEGMCSADAPASVLLDSSPSFGSLNQSTPAFSRGMVPGGGFCHENANCYSNYCYDGICSPDGPAAGTIADGGDCDGNSNCYSSYCRNGICATAAAKGGKLAPGAKCVEEVSVCDESYKCINGYCTRTDETNVPETGENAKLHSILLSKGPCWKHAQCRIGWCLHGRCTAPWFVLDKWKGASAAASSSRISMRTWPWTAFAVVLYKYIL